MYTYSSCEVTNCGMFYDIESMLFKISWLTCKTKHSAKGNEWVETRSFLDLNKRLFGSVHLYTDVSVFDVTWNFTEVKCGCGMWLSFL